MKNLFLQIFTWWNGSTWGTRFYTWRYGTRIGEDQFENVYYQGKDGCRWVQYAGYADPTTIPPGWHGWMHYRSDVSPADAIYQAHDWEQDHLPNKTGTSGAYRPQGSIFANATERPRVTGDYDAWSP